MDTTTIIVIVVAVIAALVVGGFLGAAMGRRQRTKRLQDTFGPEYDHTVDELGDKNRAENELTERIEHVKALEIRPLSENEIERFKIRWETIQANFVDKPLKSTQEADRLIAEVMEAKGYPVEDFDHQAADISVDYPDLMMDYRGLHLIAVRGRDEDVSTEEMRRAMVHGRDLLEKLMKREQAKERTNEK